MTTLNPLTKITFLVVTAFLAIAGLFYAKSFFIPLAFAAILSMLLVSACNWLEAKGINRGTASFLSVLMLVLFFAGLISLLVWQISDLAKDMQGIEQKVQGFIHKIQNYINTELGVEPERQQKLIKQQSKSGGGASNNMVTKIGAAIMGTLVNIVLVLVYIFLFLFLRSHLKNFLKKITPAGKRQKVEEITDEASEVSRKYLLGMGIMIAALWVLYGIGYSIVGVKYALFLAILCGTLELIPFVGNIAGTSVTLLMGLVQGGDTKLIIGILVTYAVVQFLQTYVLEPLIVGEELNLNPLFTIGSLVAGELLWGIPGLVLAIPLVGIVKIVCDRFEPLKPYGYLMGEEPKKKTAGFKDKIKSLLTKSRQAQ